MNIILTVGISGSHKSTWVDEFVMDKNNYVCINRDSLRKSLVRNLSGYYKRDDVNKLEEIVNKLSDGILNAAYRQGYNVVVDNTNLTQKYINQFINFQGCSSFQFKMFDASVINAKQDVLHRDYPHLSLVEAHDKLAYIDKQYEQYKLIKEWVIKTYPGKTI